MVSLADVIAGAVVPVTVAAVIWWIVQRIGGARRAAPEVAWCAAAAIGYVAGELALRARSVQPSAWTEAFGELIRPHDATDWLPMFAVGAAVIGIAIVATWPGRTSWGPWAAAVALCLALPWRLLAGSRYLPSEELREAGFGADPWRWQTAEIALPAAALVAWLTWTAAEPGPQPRIRAGLAVLTAVGAAALAGLSGSFSYALSIGAMAASLGGCAAAAWISRNPVGPRGAAGPATLVVAGMLLCGVAFSEIVWWRAALVGVAWVAAAGRIPWLAASSRKAVVLRAVLCLLPLAIAVGAAAFDFAEALQQQSTEPANPYLSL